MARTSRAVSIAIAGLLLCVAICAAGCSNIGSSNGQNSRGGNSNYTPAGQVGPTHNGSTTTKP